MRFCYANRRHTIFPISHDYTNLIPENYNDAFLRKTKELGFDALEIGLETFEHLDNNAKLEFYKRIKDFGLDIGCIRTGGTLHDAKNGPRNIERLYKGIEIAEIVEAEIVNGALSAPARLPGYPAGSLPGSEKGWNISQDASKDSMLYIYDEIAKVYQGACQFAKEKNITITAEVHQNSPVDNSWSAKLLHEKVDKENFGINPDLGNILWNYDIPEETFEDAIDSMASISKYWHCKNLFTVYHPENNRSVFIRVPLPDGEIDYRYAITSLHNANYSGYMTIEGAWAGDQWHNDYKSLRYAKKIWDELQSSKK
ncbi:MAG: hypothetical protein CL748_02515 [Chloroflexi bacterium]|nr:hypothetical protein [Chloroflexota bacterium]|tara:strand:+ start:1478 stop:2413 length:936 start_codon:yes stop_codon:yes gene_type:complete